MATYHIVTFELVGEKINGIKAAVTSSSSLKNITNELLELTKDMTVQKTMEYLSYAQVNKQLAARILYSKGLRAEQLKEAMSTYQIATATGILGTAQKVTSATTVLFSRTIVQSKFLLQGLWATLMANPLILVVGLISAVTLGVTKWKQAQEELRQTTADAAAELENSSKEIGTYADRYKELHTALHDAKDSEEETYKIKSDLLALQKELNEKYGDEYGKINLVTDAYRDQTEAILAYKRAASEKYLNENRLGINDAKQKMTEINTFQLADMISSKSSSGISIKNLAKKHGIKIAENEEYGLFSLYIKADATQAKETTNSFMTDLSKMQGRFNDSAVENVLDSSSRVMKNLQDDFFNLYGDQFQEALLAEVQTDYGRADNVLSQGYSDATAAVNEYNEALLKSSNPYDDKAVTEAYENLQIIRASIEENSSAWDGYESVISDVFSAADTRLIDFNNLIGSNKEGIGDLVSEIKDLNLSDVDLQAMSDNGANGDIFDRLSAKAKRYQVNVGELISLLVQLGVVQSTVSKQEIVKPQTKAEAISAVNALTDGFEELDKIYKSLKGKDPFDFSLLDNKNFKDTFGGLGKSYTDFVEQIASSPKDIAACQSAFNDLITTWLESTHILDDVNEDTAGVTVAMLKIMGVANAEELVMSHLADAHEYAALEKKFNAEMSANLEGATASEINKIFDEADVVDEAKQAMAGFALQKEIANGISLDTSADIENLLALVGIIGSANTALKALNTLRQGGDVGGNIGGKEGYDYLVRQAQLEIEEALKKAAEYKGKGKVNYIGGNESNKSGSKGSKPKKPTEFDAAAESVKNLKAQIDSLNGVLENTKPYDQQLRILNLIVEKQKEYFDALKKQDEFYNGAYQQSLSSLPQEWQDRITGDDNFSIDEVPESIKDAVTEAQGLKDKWVAVKQEIQKANGELDTTKQKTHDLAQTKLDNEIGLLENKITDIQNKMDEAEAMGLQSTKKQYKNLISLSKQAASYQQNKLQGYMANLIAMEVAGETNTDQYYETAEAIQNCENAISQCAQNQAKWNKAMLELPIQYLEKANDELNDQLEELQDKQNDYDSAINGVTSHLQEQIDAQQKLRDEAEKTSQAQIDAIQEQIDGLQESNDKRKQQLELEQKQYDLERAKNQKTTKVFREEAGGFIYEADQSAIRDAQDAYDDALLNKQLSDLEDKIKDIEDSRDALLDSYDNEIDRLQTIIDSWNDITDAIQRAKDMAMANSIFGAGWQDRVTSGDTSDLEDITGKYDKNDRDRSWVEEQIEANERLIREVERYVSAWQMGEISIREARESINDIVGDIAPEIEANDERVNSISTYQDQWTNANDRVSENISALNDTTANNSAEVNATNQRRDAALQYADQWANNVLSVGSSLSNITEANAAATNAEGLFLDARISKLSLFKDVYAEMASVIGDKCKSIVDACKEAERALRSLDKAENGGGSSSGGHWDSSGASGGPGVYADGILNGRLGGRSESEKEKMLKYLTTHDLKNGEIPIIGHENEVVLNPDQQEQAIQNTEKLADVSGAQLIFDADNISSFSGMLSNNAMFTKGNIFKGISTLPPNVSNSNVRHGDIKVEIANVTLPRVKDSDSFLKSMTDGSMQSAIQQQLYKRR